MRISSFNINKFCGAYTGANGGYRNPRNIDFKTSIKKIVYSLLNEKDDIVFLQEFCDNQYVRVEELFGTDRYTVFSNRDLKDLRIKSHVVAITWNKSSWERMIPAADTDYQNKFIDMKLKDKLKVFSFHNSTSQGENDIEDLVAKHFDKADRDIILGDFNDTNWIKFLTTSYSSTYRDLVTNDMITYKPAQTAIDRIFVKKTEYEGKIVFNGVTETYASDHNVLTFLVNIY